MSPTPEPNPNPQEPKPADPPALTQADLDKALTESNTKHEEQMRQVEKDNQKSTNELIASMNQRNQDLAPAPVPVPGISQDDFNKAIEEGDPSTVNKYFDQKIKENDKKWETRVNGIESYGMNAINNLSEHQAANATDMPYYNEFKDEIDAMLTKHNATRDMGSIKNAYKMVTGENINKILKMEMEKKARQENDPAGTIQPGDGKGGRMQGDDVPFNADEVLGDDAKAALNRRHDPQTPDGYIKKVDRHMGTKFGDFETYHKKRDELIKEDKEFQW